MNVYVVALLGLAAGCSTTSAGSNRAPWCPQSLPAAGTPCQPPQLATPGVLAACEYGDDPHCTSVAECGTTNEQTFFWVVSLPDPSCAGNGPYCPAVLDAGITADCPVSATCTYTGGRCFCVSCVPGPPPCGQDLCVHQDAGTQWRCDAWQEPPSCTTPRPLLGTSCSGQGQVCGGPGDPPIVTAGGGEVCADGYWVAGLGGC